MRRPATITAVWVLALALAAGCMSHIAAYHRGWDSPSGRFSVDVMGLSGLGKPYTGINDKYADTYVYERIPSSTNCHLVWHQKISIRNIGDMDVECRWTDDQSARLIFYDYGDWDPYASKTPRPQPHFVTAILLEKDHDGVWRYTIQTKNDTRPQHAPGTRQ